MGLLFELGLLHDDLPPEQLLGLHAGLQFEVERVVLFLFLNHFRQIFVGAKNPSDWIFMQSAQGERSNPLGRILLIDRRLVQFF